MATQRNDAYKSPTGLPIGEPARPSVGKKAAFAVGKVLFVDDEENVLKSIMRGFLHAGFQVFTATGGLDGLKVLENEDIDIVVTDYRMPGMDGFQFLNIVRERFPKVNRVILSGFIEKSAAVESLTRGIASTYILKPWMNDEVEDKINHILETRTILKSGKLLSIINQIETLPTLSNIYREFIDALEREKSMAEIARILQKDPSVATKVLHVANSAFYGLRNCTSINQATVTIGLDTLHDILLTLSVVRSGSWNKSRIEQLQRIFTGSYIMNALLPEIYRLKFGSHLEKNFPSVGLTYDVGKIILLQYYPDRFEEISANAGVSPEPNESWRGFHESEIRLGFAESTHQEIGAYFLDFWNLPAVFVETALYHHDPRKASVHYRDVVEIVGYIDVMMALSEGMPEGWEESEDPSAGVDPVLLPKGFFSPLETIDLVREIRKRCREYRVNLPVH
jgi:HD-like signal output (HDOD) protein